MKTLMRNGRDRRSENPSLGHAKKERVSLFGTDQRITSGPAARRPHSKAEYMTAPERFADSQIPLAPRAPSIHDPLYGPAVRCKRKRRLECTVLHQCIRPRVGAHAPDHHGNPRTSDLISGHASKGYVGHQFSDALGRPFLHLFFSLADLGGENNRGAYITFATVPAASRGLGYELHRPDLEVATAMENAPGNASDFVGERNC